MESIADADYLKDIIFNMIDGLSVLSRRYKEHGGTEIDACIYDKAKTELEELIMEMKKRYEYDKIEQAKKRKEEKEEKKKYKNNKEDTIDPALFQLASLWSCKQALAGKPEAAKFDKIIYEQIKSVIKTPQTDHTASFFEPPVSTHTEAFFAKSRMMSVDMDKLYSFDVIGACTATPSAATTKNNKTNKTIQDNGTIKDKKIHSPPQDYLISLPVESSSLNDPKLASIKERLAGNYNLSALHKP